MKGNKNVKKYLGLTTALVMGFSFTACNLESAFGGLQQASADGYAYVAVDINPSVELILEDGEVVSVSAANEDASVLLTGEDLTGDTAEEAIETIVSLAEEMGYLTEENDNVKITVAADDEEYAAEIEDEAAAGAEKGSALAKVNKEPRFADSRKCKELKEEKPEIFKDFNPAKLRLIEAIMRYDDTMTYEVGASMKFDELADMLENFVKEYEGYVSDEVENKFEEKFDEAKLEAERAIAAVYGEEYLAAWEKTEALQNALNALETSLENMSISETDIAEIAELLGLEETEALAWEGVITVDSVDRYIDRYFHGKKAMAEEREAFEEIEDQIEDILESYDEDEYVLTEADNAALSEAWGEALSFETFEDAEEFVEEQEEALEDLQDSIALTKGQEMQIHALKEALKHLKGKVREEMCEEMHEVKQSFYEDKTQRLEQFREEQEGKHEQHAQPDEHEKHEQPEWEQSPENA